MKIVDADVTRSDMAPALDADTHASPGLRPEVLGDAAQRQTKAMIHAALFKVTGEAPRIGPYQVQRQLGEGGMGVVYAAYDDKLERTVALKLIRGAAMRRPEGRARTLREARALARLSHPNVVHVYQVGEVDDEIYVAMELLTGPTLRAWLAAQPRSWREVLAVLRQAGEGLAAAHRQGVIHRDFKPANVIVGDDGRVRVLDFGLAHFFGLEGEEGEATVGATSWAATGGITDLLLTQTGAVLGTPAYMAAEQFAGGRGDAKTDQFSFCTALYEALYGQRPFVGDQLEVLASAVRGGRVHPVARRSEVPQWLHRVVVRGLQPDPAARWPGMDALLLALAPPESRVRWGRIAGATGAACTVLLGGMGYVFMLAAPPRCAAPAAEAGEDEGAAQRRVQLIAAQDGRSLVEARAMLASDPLTTIRILSMLGGDEPRTWERARFLASAAEARGLPTQLLRADRPLAEAWPLAGGGFIGREDLGTLLQWEMSEKTGLEMVPVGSATQLVVARDVPVWAAIRGRTVRVVGAGRDQMIEVGEPMYRDWRLAADGRTLMASARSTPTTAAWISTVYLWDLTRPGAPPRTIALAPETEAVVAEDAVIVLAQEARGIRVMWPREGYEKLLRYRGTPTALTADGRFVLAVPAGTDGVMDVLEISTGRARRVEAEAVTVLAGDEVLFTWIEHGRPFVRRESLATGAALWRMPLPGPAGPREQRLIVDPTNEQFAVAVGDAWGIGDLRRGALGSFVTVPKDSRPQWAGAGALMVVVGHELRIYRPATASVQLRHEGAGCGLAPGGRFAVVQPRDAEAGVYTRVELATRRETSFRCPEAKGKRRGSPRAGGVSAVVDDAGQVALFGSEGWSCWWDEQHGVRPGARGLAGGLLAELPRGVALAEAAEVELWAGPETRAQRWTAAGPVVELVASPSGGLLAARSEAGVEVLHVDSGAVMAVPTWARPTGAAEVLASALAWSPDSTRLAVLDQVGGTLELSVWDVVGAPREVVPPNHVMLGGHVLEDSPGRSRNRMTFTPGGAAVVVTNRHESLLSVDLATHETRRIEVPDLLELHMRGETDAVGIDVRGVPVLIDFAAWEVSALTPNPELGAGARPQLRAGEDGAVWSCGALGPGTLIEVAAMEEASVAELRARLLDRALSQ